MTATAVEEHDTVVERMTGGMAPSLARFGGSERLRPDGRPRPELRDQLRHVSNARNAMSSFGALAAPVLVVAAVSWIGAWWAAVLAIPVMASLQLRMYILHHEAAHRLLFTNRWWNDFVGVTIMGWVPVGTGSHTYRRVHAAHHKDEFGPNEPDFLLYAMYPIERASFWRKIRRDGFGVSAWRQIKPRLAGLLVAGRRRAGLRLLGMQAAVFAVFAVAGEPWLFLFLWILPYLTWYQVANRLRALSEHGGMTRSKDRRRTTHIVEISVWSRMFLAPLNVGCHLAHHVDSGIPMRSLPILQRVLIEDGYVPDAIVWPSYLALWRALASGQPGQRQQPQSPPQTASANGPSAATT